MYPIPSSEILEETRTCRQCAGEFPITDKDMEFYTKVSPIFGGKKYQIPPPTLCPDCREQRRFAFRNERKLYVSRCSITGEKNISIFSPDKPFKVYNIHDWWSDKWNPLDYGMVFDFWKGFFEQFSKLSFAVPRCSIFANISGSTNSEHSNHTANLKNCYLVFSGYDCEDCFFCNLTNHSHDCVDSTFCTRCDECYQCIDSKDLSQSRYSINCYSSNNLFFCCECSGCSDCFGCHNLTNKKYCIENQQYSE